ncbi:thiamine pyrophosphokinase, vitamin b1 binding domain-containing protein [Phthorimaea operculella]|nr:thiamine pyrophosphokinase, vitamin b1 binding domain-containing protein [Phthorimaea operculella]
MILKLFRTDDVVDCTTFLVEWRTWLSLTKYILQVIIHTPDQDYTDFTKALMELRTFCEVNNIEINYVIAFGQSSGRIDQILGIIQTLFLVKERQLLDDKMRVFVITDDALSWLLLPGDHWIDIPEQTWSNKRAWCSLVPVGEPCDSVTTNGLKWNLVHQPLRFGDLVSTSNSFDCADEGVTIKCSHPLLWSMRVPAIKGADGFRNSLDTGFKNSFDCADEGVTIKCSHPLLWSMRVPAIKGTE